MRGIFVYNIDYGKGGYMKIVVLDSDTLTLDGDIDFSELRECGELTIYRSTPDDKIGERIRNADAVLCNKSQMNAENLSRADNLKYIGLFATGYNNVDLRYTKTHGIIVCNAGSYSTDAVAQHTFALILEHYNHVSQYDKFVKEGGWINTERFSPFINMEELSGKTIGIIAYGSIGKKVAQIAKAFGMNILAYSRRMNRRNGERTEAFKFVCMEELLTESDIISLHCPLNDDSYKMCDKKFFDKMKNDALFVNTSRGGVVDEPALIEALNGGIIGGAALDVIQNEPMTKCSGLLEARNIIITPHAAWAPFETRSRLVKIVCENLKKWVAGTPVNVIE